MKTYSSLVPFGFINFKFEPIRTESIEESEVVYLEIFVEFDEKSSKCKYLEFILECTKPWKISKNSVDVQYWRLHFLSLQSLSSSTANIITHSTDDQNCSIELQTNKQKKWIKSRYRVNYFSGDKNQQKNNDSCNFPLCLLYLIYK